MKALIFSNIALSLIRPIKSTTAVPVINLHTFSCLFFFPAVAVSFVCFICLFASLFV